MEKDQAETNGTKAYMSSLEMPYDLRSHHVLRNFISGNLDMLNVTPKEQQVFFLAAEEVFSYILFHYVSPEEGESMQVRLIFSPDSELRFEFQYLGTPIREQQLATYDKGNVSDENMDKLWYHLVESVMDEFEFINLGNDGWRIVFSKRIDGACYNRRVPKELQESEAASNNVREATYRLSVPADADALVELTHKTYAYSFADMEFYFAEHLASAIREKSIVSVVAELAGELIGHVGLVYHSGYPDCAEVGLLMVDPKYQGTRLSFYLSNKFKKSIYNQDKYKKSVFTTVSTTTHKASQHMISKMASLYPVMLMLSACPRADYKRAASGGGSEREAFLFSVRLMYDSELSIYLPQIHHPVMSALFEQLNAGANLLDLEKEEFAPETTISIQRFELSHSANIVLDSCSCCWAETVRKKMYALRCEGIKTINIMVPAWEPLPPDLRDNMRRMNAFFVGVPIFAEDKWYVAYVAPDSESINFDEIDLYNQGAQDLLVHVKDEFEYVFGPAEVTK